MCPLLKTLREKMTSLLCYACTVVNLIIFFLLKALVEKCPFITSVVFIGAPHISDSAFKVLSACDLRRIRFEGL